MGSLTVAETEVFNDDSPGLVWTDLDLSAVVGANPALVILKVHQTLNWTNYLAVRKNGDTDEQYYESTAPAGSGTAICSTVNYWLIVTVATDAAGIIEWKTKTAAKNITIDVIAYFK